MTSVQDKPRYGHVCVETALVLVGVTAAILYGGMFVGIAAKNVMTHANSPALATQAAVSLETPIATLRGVKDDSAASYWRQMAISAGWIAVGAGAVFCICRKPRASSVDQIAPENLSVSMEVKQSRLFEKRQNVLRILNNDTQALFESRMTVGQLMTTHVRTVAASATIAELKHLCREHKIRHLLVCDDSGQLVGIVSDRDLTVRTGKIARDIMTAEPKAVTTGTLVGPAMTMFLDHRFHCLPVIEAGVPCGVLTSSDFMIALQCALQLLAKSSATTTLP